MKMSDAVALFVAANEIEGEDVTIIFDVRAAVVFALIVGAIAMLIGLRGWRQPEASDGLSAHAQSQPGRRRQ